MSTVAKDSNPTEPSAIAAKSSVAVIACGILRDELKAITEMKKDESARVLFLAPAPCIDYGKLEKQLTILLERASEIAQRTVVVIGLCHPDIEGILSRFGAARVSMNNCFEALLGSGRMKDLLREKNTFFTTPAWLKQWRRALKQGMKWDEVDTRQNFGVYERIVVLDSGVTSYSDEDILEYFDYTQVPVEIEAVDLKNLGDLLLSEIARQ